MNYIQRSLGILSVVFAMTACTKKTLPTPPDGNTPTFYFHGVIGEDTMHWQAGENDFFMHTDYFKDAQQLWVMRGQLGPSNCADCAPSLSIELRDIALSNDSSLVMDFPAQFMNSDWPGFNIDTVRHEEDVEVFTFFPLTQQPITQVLWNFGDGSTSTELSPKHIFQGSGTRDVSLRVHQGANSDSLKFPIDITYKSPNRLFFSWNLDAGNHLDAYVSFGSFPTVLWDGGNGQYAVGQFSAFNYNPGLYVLSCRGINGTKEAWYKAKIKVPTGSSWANPNFRYTTKLVKDTLIQHCFNNRTALITLKQHGKIYHSFKQNGIAGSGSEKTLHVKGYSLYDNNVQGHATVWVDADMDIWLYNSNNASDSIRIQSNQTRFALAYPKNN